MASDRQEKWNYGTIVENDDDDDDDNKNIDCRLSIEKKKVFSYVQYMTLRCKE